MPGSTLIRPPPADASKSAMENVLELIALRDIGPDIFTNARELWHPPGARGIYGGAVIAQCLAAAQHTVPPPSPANDNAVYLIHSMHCYFVLAGDATIPIIYHVERVREGKSFTTRTVQARQRGKCIFTTTLSFMREGSGGEIAVNHGWDIPEGVRDGLDRILREHDAGNKESESTNTGVEAQGPFISKKYGVSNENSPYPHHRKPQAWIRCRGSISPPGGQHAHLSALAYMSDSWFIGTVSRAHRLVREGHALYNETFPQDHNSASKQQTGLESIKQSKNTYETPNRSIGMMVSLDHTIFFHRPREVKADEWLFTEMETPWSGEGRGLVTQRIWNEKGRLIATCVQEGLVRLEQDAPATKSKL